MKFIMIAFGGAIGAILRYTVGGFIQELMQSSGFPYGTMFVNILGCLVIGICSYLAETHAVFSPEARFFLFIGLLGSFTTFSTFGNESMNLFRDSQSILAFANILIHVVFGLGAVWLGRTTAYLIWR